MAFGHGRLISRAAAGKRKVNKRARRVAAALVKAIEAIEKKAAEGRVEQHDGYTVTDRRRNWQQY